MEKNIKLSIAKILGVIVTLISIFMLVNVANYSITTIIKGTEILDIINVILTIIYMLIIICISGVTTIQLFKFKEEDKLKRLLFYLSCILLAFYISVLQEKMIIAYATYFLIAIYFLLVFTLTKDSVIKKKESNTKVEENIEKDKKASNKKSLSTVICTVILIILILLTIGFETISYFKVSSMVDRYNDINKELSELNVENSEELKEETAVENISNMFIRETTIYILKVVYFSLTGLLLIISKCIKSKKIKKVNEINMWIMLIVSAFLAANIAIYYYISFIVVFSKMLKSK